MDIIYSRISRVSLDTTKFYEQVKTSADGTVSIKYLGKFIKSYKMGSGDGTTVHCEFDNNGVITRIDEEMWGSVSGRELSYFRQVG